MLTVYLYSAVYNTFDANYIIVRYDSRNGAFLGRRRGDLVGIDLMLTAYDEDLNRNMY